MPNIKKSKLKSIRKRFIRFYQNRLITLQFSKLWWSSLKLKWFKLEVNGIKQTFIQYKLDRRLGYLGLIVELE